MGTTWILVADASRAKIYSQADPVSAMHMVQTFEHAASRMKGAELASDRTGRILSKGTGHGSLADPTDPKEFEAARFAQKLAQALNKGRAANVFQQLVVVAPAHFSGELNRHLGAHTREMIGAAIHKDYTQLPPKELAAALGGHLRF